MSTSSTLVDFQTPPRILIPKLLRSRDGWKSKATERKKQRKALEIRVRDLTASRDRQRQRATTLQEELETARLQLEHSQQQLRQSQQQRATLQARLDQVAVPVPDPTGSMPLDPVGSPQKSNC